MGGHWPTVGISGFLIQFVVLFDFSSLVGLRLTLVTPQPQQCGHPVRNKDLFIRLNWKGVTESGGGNEREGTGN